MKNLVLNQICKNKIIIKNLIIKIYWIVLLMKEKLILKINDKKI